jgi:eukaryotic-like serine/threonine-protein kinase
MSNETNSPDSVSKAGSPVAKGDVLDGKYVVERVLGVGGMGVVVAARHKTLGSEVALKFLKPDAAEAPLVCARFLREAQTVTRLAGEHVARVLDVGTLASGSPYMVMEYLEGRDLGILLQERGPLPIADAVDYLVQACEAVAQAHAQGIVHRDLKPANLFLAQGPDHSPLIKVLDFGISKAKSHNLYDSDLTDTRGLMGSPLYMSPEQIRSAKYVDTRSDLWSLGVILYELLTGSVPFLDKTAGAVLAMIIADPPTPPRAHNPHIPPGLENVILRCLTKDVEARYQTVAELARDLAPFGSAAAAIAVGRISKIAGLHEAPLVVSRASVAELTPAAASPALTAGGWASQKSGPSRGLLVAVSVAAAAVIGLVLIALVVVVRRSNAPSAEPVSDPIQAVQPAPAPTELSPVTGPTVVPVAPVPPPSGQSAPAESAEPADAGRARPVSGVRPRGTGKTAGDPIESLIKNRK